MKPGYLVLFFSGRALRLTQGHNPDSAHIPARLIITRVKILYMNCSCNKRDYKPNSAVVLISGVDFFAKPRDSPHFGCWVLTNLRDFAVWSRPNCRVLCYGEP
jgi:hypothetical protein